jgi:protein kinase C substrate 80K-H
VALPTRAKQGCSELECCDGSDEKSGVCPNKCKEIGDAHRTKMEAERKLRKTVGEL